MGPGWLLAGMLAGSLVPPLVVADGPEGPAGVFAFALLLPSSAYFTPPSLFI